MAGQWLVAGGDAGFRRRAPNDVSATKGVGDESGEGVDMVGLVTDMLGLDIGFGRGGSDLRLVSVGRKRGRTRRERVYVF